MRKEVDVPYGSKTLFSYPNQVWTRRYLTGGSPKSVVPSPYVVADVYTRSGTDRNTTIRQKRSRARSYTYVLKRVPIPFYYTRKYRDLYGKWRRERVAVTIVRLVRTRVPIERPRWKNSLLVNDLTLTSSKLVATQAADISIKTRGVNYYPSYPSWSIQGDTWYLGNSWPLGLGGTGSPSLYHPDSFGASSLSSDYSVQIGKLQAKSLGSVYEKAKAQNVNLANFLAEIGKTKSSFIEIVKRLASVFLSAKRGNWKKAWKSLAPDGVGTKQLSNDYLMWTYGVKPLLMDIDGMSKQLAEGFQDGEEIVVKSANSIHEVTRSNGTVASALLCRRETLEVDTTITVKAVLKYKLSNPALQGLSQLGFTNPATVAYELTPWSFVIDWLIPIGNWLDSLDTWLMLQPVSYHETTVVKQVVTCVAVHSGNAGSIGYECDTTGGTTFWKKENVYVSRRVKSMPAPPPPQLKNPFTDGHILNALALLRQLIH